MKQVFMVDCDGVICRFNQGMVRLLEATSSRRAIVDANSEDWITDWTWHELAGFSKREWSGAYDYIKRNPWWWRTLEPYPHAKEILRALVVRENSGDEVYFVTSRFPSQARTYASGWLDAHGFSNPSVILTTDAAHKGRVAAAIRANVAIDDSIDNANEIKSSTHGYAETWLVRRPWNERVEAMPGVVRVAEDMVARRIRVGREAEAA